MRTVPGTITDYHAEVRAARAAQLSYLQSHEGEQVFVEALLADCLIVSPNTAHNGDVPDVVRVETIDRLPEAGGRYISGTVEETGESWGQWFAAATEVELVEAPTW